MLPRYIKLSLFCLYCASSFYVLAGNYDVLGTAFRPQPPSTPAQVVEPQNNLEINIPASSNNMYFIEGSVNKSNMKFLIDTGATYTTFNRKQAETLKLDYLKGKKTVANTASGTTLVYLVNIDSIKIGPIEKRNIKAYIVDGDRPYYALLGMSFLDDLEIIKKKDILTIQTAAPN